MNETQPSIIIKKEDLAEDTLVKLADLHYFLLEWDRLLREVQ